jgi:pimeloyl-ACP methyl ester carboxylesterase/SH3-like domain-containing protein
MPTLEINGAQIYYETFGKDQPGRAPIFLIHGSTITGQRDWGLVAPLLGREYRVIVPDCRGHGQSSNPRHSYSFKELAEDTRALIQALGYPKAHIIGHSNGGNVVLVTLLEHPEVVQSAVIQAANAYVTPDLVEEEPPKFDPDRVASEVPGWRDEMIELHGAVHGEAYWRELLQLTVREIISQPNYTPEDLQKASRAVLAIQGEGDRVNARSGHAQFIAEHIPYAELWVPQGVGHNVHQERLFEWVQKVLDFLQRRGEAASEALYRLGQDRFRDERETVFEVQAESLKPGSAEGTRLAGRVLTAQEQQAAVRSLEQAGLGPVDAGGLHILLNESTPWALVRRGVADLRREPRSFSERVSQVLYGECLRILQAGEEYSWVQMVEGGYMGWVHSAALWGCTAEEAQAYWRSLNGLVSVERAALYGTEMDLSQEKEADLKVSTGRLSFGVPVCVAEASEGWLALRTPEGEKVWVQGRDILPLSQRPKPDAPGIAFTLDLIRRFAGIPYLWGGRTSFGYDCSGLAQAFYAFMGVGIPRDADLQCRDGMPVTGDPEPGDLLFFGKPGVGRADERYRHVTHVAISLGGAEYLHAKGGSMGITVNSLDPLSPVYNAYLKEHLLALGRFR